MAEPTSRSTAELVMDVADDLRMLVRKEIELARIELMEGLQAQLIGAGTHRPRRARRPCRRCCSVLFSLAFWLPFSREVSFAIVGGGTAGCSPSRGSLIGHHGS